MWKEKHFWKSHDQVRKCLLSYSQEAIAAESFYQPIRSIQNGDLEVGFKQADHIIEGLSISVCSFLRILAYCLSWFVIDRWNPHWGSGTFLLGVKCHTGCASRRGRWDGALRFHPECLWNAGKIISKTQPSAYWTWIIDGNVSLFQCLVAKVLGVPNNRVVIRVKRMGGGFGGKESRSTVLSTVVAVAADKYIWHTIVSF